MRTLFLLLAAISTATIHNHAQIQRLVDVGDHRLRVLQAGSGKPAVVFECGLWDTLDYWARVWPHLAEFTTVVAYSRAGLGGSEISPRPHSAMTAVSDLHVLLRALAIQPPYVLVGHSYGGILIRLYASTFPAEVAGLVLVDASNEQGVKRMSQLDSSYSGFWFTLLDSLSRSSPPAQSAEAKEVIRIQSIGAVEGMKPLPDVPIAVLTSMKTSKSPSNVGDTMRGHELWRAEHDDWVRSARDAVHISTSRSGHEIQADEPQLVIDAIRFVLDRVRAR